jgi:hypothetical protein
MSILTAVEIYILQVCDFIGVHVIDRHRILIGEIWLMFVLIILGLQNIATLLLSPTLSDAPDNGYYQTKKYRAYYYYVNCHEKCCHSPLIIISVF